MGNAPKQTFLKERLTTSKWVPESIFNTNHHWEIITQTHTEISLPLVRKDIIKHKKDKTNKELNKEEKQRKT